MRTTVDHALIRGLVTAGPVMRRGASSERVNCRRCGFQTQPVRRSAVWCARDWRRRNLARLARRVGRF